MLKGYHLWFCNRCPVRSTITGYGVSISNEENSRAGYFIGRGKIESFNILDQEPIRLDYRAKICTGQCKQVHFSICIAIWTYQHNYLLVLFLAVLGNISYIVKVSRMRGMVYFHRRLQTQALFCFIEDQNFLYVKEMKKESLWHEKWQYDRRVVIYN